MITTGLLVGLNGAQKAACHPSEEKAGVSALCKVRLASYPARSATTPRITLRLPQDLCQLHFNV